MSAARMVRCSYVIDGPQVGRRVVAWRKQCGRKVAVPEGVTSARCWQHGGGKAGRSA